MTREQRTIRKEYKDALSHDAEYQKIEEQLKELKEQKKRVELHTQETMGSRWQKFEELKADITDHKEMISDIAMTTIMKGESIEISDDEQTVYEPKFTVTFKKTSAKKMEEE